MNNPKPCNEWVERLSAYADGEATPTERPATEQHVSGCEACREWLRLVQDDARWYTEAYAEPARGEAYVDSVTAKLPAKQGSPEARRAGTLTLAELLAVMGIIAILGVTLSPTFARAREKARQTSCLSNLKQLALGMQMFAQEHNNRLPSALTWKREITPYVKNEQLFRCPTDESDQACSYAMNYELSEADLNTLASPEEQILLYEADESGAPARRHNEGLNIAFADGHAKWYRDPPRPVTSGLSLGARDRNYGLAEKLHLSYDATMTVRSDDALASLRSATEVIREQGGFVLQADFRQERRLATSTLTCKVPGKNLETTLASLQALGTTTSQQLAGQDLTQDVVAVATALRRESAKHTRLSREANRTAETPAAAGALAAVEQSEQRTLDSRRKQYEVLSQTVLATVCATFQSPVPPPSARAPIASAFASGCHWSSRTLGVAGAWALGFAPVWAPVVLVVWVGGWWLRRRRAIFSAKAPRP